MKDESVMNLQTYVFFPLFSQRHFDQQRHSNFVWANKRISGQFSHARITWTKEECSFNPGLRYSPVDTCAYLCSFFLFFIFYF